MLGISTSQMTRKGGQAALLTASIADSALLAVCTVHPSFSRTSSMRCLMDGSSSTTRIQRGGAGGLEDVEEGAGLCMGNGGVRGRNARFGCHYHRPLPRAHDGNKRVVGFTVRGLLVPLNF